MKGAIVQLFKFPYADHLWERRNSTLVSNSKAPTFRSNDIKPIELDPTRLIIDFFQDQHCVLQTRNNRKCSSGDRVRSAAGVMVGALVIFLTMWSPPTS